ncbi:MAG TPA: carboxypeptidase regulatory-like domain-containing protein, partial [Blastocatellia bacterium]|nr:carboxypeptidase regulatory-like domain-containing protein [Blastocatellia bacterium]
MSSVYRCRVLSALFISLLLNLTINSFAQTALSNPTTNTSSQIETQAGASSQPTGSLRGTVTLASNGNALHGVMVTVSGIKQTASTDDQGQFELRNIPPGTYSVLTHLDGFPDAVKTVTIEPNTSANV